MPHHHPTTVQTRPVTWPEARVKIDAYEKEAARLRGLLSQTAANELAAGFLDAMTAELRAQMVQPKLTADQSGADGASSAGAVP